MGEIQATEADRRAFWLDVDIRQSVRGWCESHGIRSLHDGCPATIAATYFIARIDELEEQARQRDAELARLRKERDTAEDNLRHETRLTREEWAESEARQRGWGG